MPRGPVLLGAFVVVCAFAFAESMQTDRRPGSHSHPHSHSRSTHSHSKRHHTHKAKRAVPIVGGHLVDFMGRPLTDGGASTDPTTPAGLVDRFLIAAKISPADSAKKPRDPDAANPNRHAWTFYTQGGTITTMIVDQEKRFDFDELHPPPFETAAVNMVYYVRRMDAQLLEAAGDWGKAYGFESALKRLREIRGKHAVVNPGDNTNYFAAVQNVMGNREHRDLLPSSPQRVFFRIIFVAEQTPPLDQMHKALGDALNVVVFQLHSRHLKQLWPQKGHAEAALPLSSASEHSGESAARPPI